MAEPIITIRATEALLTEIDEFAQRHNMSRSGAGLFLLAFGVRNERIVFRTVARQYLGGTK